VRPSTAQPSAPKPRGRSRAGDPEGPLFETAAILPVLADRHGAMARAASGRAWRLLKVAVLHLNTVHAQLRMLFLSRQIVGDESRSQRPAESAQLTRQHGHLTLPDGARLLDARPASAGSTRLTAHLMCSTTTSPLFLRAGAVSFRWVDRMVADLNEIPVLLARLEQLERRPARARRAGRRRVAYTLYRAHLCHPLKEVHLMFLSCFRDVQSGHRAVVSHHGTGSPPRVSGPDVAQLALPFCGTRRVLADGQFWLLTG